jgi:hypothetical protein
MLCSEAAMPSLATIIISLTVVCSTACSANAAEGRYLCEPVVANGKSWTQLAGRKSKVFYVDASCRALDSPGKEYMPTGGGFMYDGGAEDPAMLSDWRIISSVPYDRTYSQNPRHRKSLFRLRHILAVVLVCRPSATGRSGIFIRFRRSILPLLSWLGLRF